MGAAATVIIPTFGQASFAQWAIHSVRQQSVRDIEICVICDGSPEPMVAFLRTLAQQDPRMKVFAFPKSPRTGEPYRDAVIRQTTGKIVCYCSHDDLWLANHVQEMAAALATCRFAHSLDAVVNLPEKIAAGNGLFQQICLANIATHEIVRKMFRGSNYFGLTYGAHTRDSYFQLKEGWVTTPRQDVPTDLYMWCKFLAAFPRECRTVRKITALNFPYGPRAKWPAQQRDDELKHYFEKSHDPQFVREISRTLLKHKVDDVVHRALHPGIGGRRLLKRLWGTS